MKTKISYLLIFLGCMLIFPLTSDAKCSYEREAELSRIAANVQFNYTYDIDSNSSPVFTVYITNLTNDIYVKDNFDQTFSGNSEASQVYPNQNVDIAFDIYSNDNNCKNTKILTNYLNLPSYNGYSTRNECQEYPDYHYCALWMNTLEVSTSAFEEGFNKYKQKEETKNIVQEENEGLLTIFLNLLEQYYYVLIAVLILIFAIVIKKRLG